MLTSCAYSYEQCCIMRCKSVIPVSQKAKTVKYSQKEYQLVGEKMGPLQR